MEYGPKKPELPKPEGADVSTANVAVIKKFDEEIETNKK